MTRGILYVWALAFGATTAAFCQSNGPVIFTPPLSGGVVATNAGAPGTRPRPKILRPERVTGTLLRIDGTNLVIRAMLRGVTNEVVVPTDSHASYKVNGPTGRFEDLKPGMIIMASRLNVVGRPPAKLMVVARDPEYDAVVVKAEGTNLLVKVTQPDGKPKETPVVITEFTKIQLLVTETNGEASAPIHASMEDLKPGMKVTILPGSSGAARISGTTSPDSPKPQQ